MTLSVTASFRSPAKASVETMWKGCVRASVTLQLAPGTLLTASMMTTVSSLWSACTSMANPPVGCSRSKMAMSVWLSKEKTGGAVVGKTLPWRAALDSNELPWVPLYKSMKHTQISALRDAGLPVDDILEQCRWTPP